MKEKAYYENVNVKNEVKLRKLLEQLPDFCKQFFIGIEPTTSSRTRIAYAYDIGCFFDYLCDVNPICQNYTVKDIPLSLLDELTPMDIEEYLSYLKYYEKKRCRAHERRARYQAKAGLSPLLLSLLFQKRPDKK